MPPLRDNDPPDEKRLGVRLSREEKRRLKIAAARHELSLRAAIVRAIEWLEATAPSPGPRRKP